MKRPLRKKDIAIIGMSGKYPKSENLKEFWRNLLEGEELIHFYSDEELKEKGVSDENIKKPNYIKADSFIDNPGSFDYSFFGYTKNEAASMDPQIRMLHEQTWLALEDAGCNPSTTKNKIGLYLAASDNLNWRAYTSIHKNEKVNPFFLDQISNKNFASTLISYKLNLKGPSYYVDTACSSSLTAVHMACRSLLLKECSVAIAGGVSVKSTQNIGYLYQEGMITSKDGHCRAFDSDSSGTISGEGVGMVVLKRLEDAITDKDHIYAVIRSSVVNNDGNRKVGYTAPSIKGQYECIKSAHQIAGVTPESISYIEAHGTATKLGDPIEIEALNKAFDNTNHTCAIGSVKTNIGHLDAASGITGLIKTTLAIKNKELPATLHFNKPNPQIDFESGPFYVNAERTLWENKTNIPLRAGVSSFGIGGNNAHVILEEAIENNTPNANKPFHLLRFSAQTSSSLERYHHKLKSFLEQNKETNISNLAYTLLVGRDQFKYNRFLVCDSKNDALTILEEPMTELLHSATLQKKRNIVFMCTGSGSQYLNMGKDLYENEPYFKKMIDKGFSYLHKITGVDFSKIVYSNITEKGLKLDINKNEYTQPIVFIFEYAIAKLFIHWGIVPDQLIGHSTGEYVAACLSEVFSYEVALNLVVKRAKLMSQTPKGSMLSVGLSKERLSNYLNDSLEIAAINSPEYCVVSGTIDAVNELYEELEKQNISSSRLRISLGAHSFLMDPILNEFREELKGIKFSDPKIPFVSNLTGKFITKEEATSPDYWVSHLRNTVRFSEGITCLMKDSNTVFLEIGPSNALTTMFQQHPKTKGNIAMNLVRHPRQDINDHKYILQKLGELWINGIDVNWEAYYESEIPVKISAPGYCFEKTRLPAKVDPFKNLNLNSQNGSIGFEEELIDEQIDQVYEEREDLLVKYIPPSNETESTLVEIWKEFFNIEKIGVLDDFFAIGGNSLKGVTMLKLIQKTFNIEIKIKDFYKKSNIKELAEEINLALRLVHIQRESKNTKTIKI